MPSRSLRLLRVSLAFAAVATALALSSSVRQAAGVRAQSANAVSMVNNSYQPGTITIAAGSTVTWVNNEDPNGTDVTHDVIADDVSWSSDYLSPGQSFSQEFDTPGTYTYSCDLHDNMAGTIVVQ